jgi:SAM-dependent methyltransferase
MNLICPQCRAGLVPGSETELRCSGCDRRFAVIDGVPILGPDSESEQHAHQRRYFDAEFSRYAEYGVENWRASFIERIFAALRIPRADGAYLDVGVGGSGATVIEAARLGMAAVGCDLSVEGVLRARAFAASQDVNELASFVVCAAERLPFPDGAFVCASAVALLEHLDDDGQAASELARVTAPGGLVWVTVPHAFRFMIPPVWPVYWIHDRRIGHKRHYDIDRLSGLMSASGFERVAVQFSGHPVKLVQFAFTVASSSVRATGSHLWWALERRDRSASGRRYGAVHLNAVYRRRG